MEASSISPAVQRWMVSNGRQVVGPVDTELLLEGITTGRVPRQSWVRDLRWSRWRRAESLREVHAMEQHKPDDDERSPVDVADLAAGALDFSDKVRLTLETVRAATGASMAVAYRRRDPANLFVASVISGAVGTQLLGQMLWEYDASLQAARRGEIVVGTPSSGPGGRSIARHLNQTRLKGVALCPLFGDGDLVGVLEFGRSDHPFRGSDGAMLAGIAYSASQMKNWVL